MKSNYLFRLFVRNKTGFYGVLLLSLLAYDVVILSFNNTKYRSKFFLLTKLECLILFGYRTF